MSPAGVIAKLFCARLRATHKVTVTKGDKTLSRSVYGIAAARKALVELAASV